jgi:DNA mismatch repair ATPase MutS
MNFFRSKKRFILACWLVAASIQTCCLHAATAQSDVYKKIGDSYLQSFPQLDSVEEPAAVDPKSLELKTVALSEAEQRKIVFEALQKNASVDESSSVLGAQVLKDLELLYGEGVDQSKHLFSKIDRTHTKVGQAVLAKKLLTPKIGNELLVNQEAVKTIVSDSAIFESLNENLECAKSAEPGLLSFWKEISDAEKAYINKTYFTRDRLKLLNSSSYAMEVWTRLGQMNTAMWVTSPIWGYSAAKVLGTYLQNKIGAPKKLTYDQRVKDIGEDGVRIEMAEPFKKIFGDELGEKTAQELIDDLNKYPKSLKGAFFDSFKDMKNFVRNIPNSVKNLKEGYKDSQDTFAEMVEKIKSKHTGTKEELETILKVMKYARYGGLVLGYGARFGIPAAFGYFLFSKTKNSFDRNKECAKISRYLQSQLISVATYLDSMKNISEIVEKNESLVKAIPSIKKIQTLFDGKSVDTSSELRKLASLLSTNTFKGEASFFSLTGRVLAAFKLMEECKDELVGSMEALGEVDAYLSIAKLYKEHADKPAKYAFAQFVEGDTPYIKLSNFWNPFIDPEVVVSNSIELGGDSACNAVVTGPNAGGKSTSITAITMNLLLAQSFGIAPADEVIMTPFSRINTYLNIADDKAIRSRFEAEVFQAQNLMNSIEELPRDQFSFTIMDEIFSGTNAVEAEAAAYSVAKSLAKNTNSICMIATHFTKLTELQKDTNSYANYKVSVVKNDDGSLTYPYLLQHGITNQRIALDILRENGFDSELVKEAQALVNNR